MSLLPRFPSLHGRVSAGGTNSAWLSIHMCGVNSGESFWHCWLVLSCAPASRSHTGREADGDYVVGNDRRTDTYILPAPICCLSPNSCCCKEQSPGLGGKFMSRLSSLRAVRPALVKCLSPCTTCSLWLWVLCHRLVYSDNKQSSGIF